MDGGGDGAERRQASMVGREYRQDARSEELKILSAVKVREDEAAQIVERARKDGERIEAEARERADKEYAKAVEDAHAHSALYLEKARLEAHKEAARIKADGEKEAAAIAKSAEKRVGKAVGFVLKGLFGGRE